MQEKKVNPYVVKVKYTVEEEAMINIAANSSEDASTAALQIFAEHPEYGSPEVVSAEVYSRQNQSQSITLQ